MVIVPALLMVSTIRFRSFKTSTCSRGAAIRCCCWSPSGLAVLAASPRFLLLVMAYTYLASAFVGMAWHGSVAVRRVKPARERQATRRRSAGC